MYIHTHTSMYLIRWTHAYVCIYVYIYMHRNSTEPTTTKIKATEIHIPNQS